MPEDDLSVSQNDDVTPVALDPQVISHSSAQERILWLTIVGVALAAVGVVIAVVQVLKR